MSEVKNSDPQALARACADHMYARDKASQGLGIELVEVRPGYAHMRMKVRGDMINGHGICHGAFFFALADSAFAFSCNTYNRVTVASGVDINFRAPAHAGDELKAVATERSRSGRTGVYDVVISNQDGVELALFRGRSYAVRGAVLPESEGKNGAKK